MEASGVVPYLRRTRRRTTASKWISWTLDGRKLSLWWKSKLGAEFQPN
jgi:hypothetical protein